MACSVRAHPQWDGDTQGLRLIAYIGVLAASSTMALYYLLAKPETRITTRNTSGGLAVPPASRGG